MKRALLICSAWVLCYVHLYGQVNITSANYNTVSLNETNALQAIVLNNGNSMVVTASVSCRNAGGEIILEAVSKPFTLNQGMNTVSGLSTGFSKFSYGVSSQALYLKNNGILSSGNFVYCLKIDVMGNAEDGDMFCEDFASAMDDFLDLVVPYDGDSLDTKFPVLTWTHSEPFSALAKNEYYKILVAEIEKDQSAEQAILSNPSVFTKSFLGSHSIPYPSDAKELQEGKTYAWQVQKFSNNVMVNKTDVWRFSLKDKKRKSPLKYVMLRTEPDNSSYPCMDDRIYFRYDEKYSSSDLNFVIADSKNKIYDDAVVQKDSQAQVAQLKNVGANLYELDLSPLNLKKGHYRLIVTNDKNKSYYLNFNISE